MATGYRYTTPPPVRPTTGTFDNAATLFLDELDADDLLQGGPAVRVGANVAGGVLFDKALAYSEAGIEGDDDKDGVKNGDEDDDGDGVKNRDDTDRDGNGIPDASQTTASISSLGGAPALLIGSTSNSVTLGAVGTGDAAYGLINRGTITGSGLYSGVEARAVQLGVTGGQTVNIVGGVRNEGGITSTALDANATSIWVGSGVTTPMISNAMAASATAMNLVTGFMRPPAAWLFLERRTAGRPVLSVPQRFLPMPFGQPSMHQTAPWTALGCLREF